MVRVNRDATDGSVLVSAWTCAGGGYISTTIGLTDDEARTLVRGLVALVGEPPPASAANYGATGTATLAEVAPDAK